MASQDLLKNIEQGKELKHVEVVDKSVPVIEAVEIKKVDRSGFLNEISSEHQLKHADTVDKSVPVIGMLFLFIFIWFVNNCL